MIPKVKGMSYNDYLNKIQNEEPEEYAFYKLYERMEFYVLDFFKKILRSLSFLDKPTKTTGNISKSASKLNEKINTTLQFIIYGADEVVFGKMLKIYSEWISNCSDESALVSISPITARFASKNPKMCGTLIPEVIG